MHIVIDVFAEIVSTENVIDHSAALADKPQLDRALFSIGYVAHKLSCARAQHIAMRPAP